MFECMMCGIDTSYDSICDVCMVDVEKEKQKAIPNDYMAMPAISISKPVNLYPYPAYTASAILPEAVTIPSPVKKRLKKKVVDANEPLATVIQEQPYRIYQIKRRPNTIDFLTWLNGVKDNQFGITMGKETIKFKTPRDVSNFMLGFNVCSDMMNGMF